MPAPPTNRPFAYVIFCDDVRQEVGDKKTLVGVYGTELYLPELPMLIPKFYIVATLICYLGETPKELAISLTFDGKEFDRHEMSKAELEEWRLEAERDLKAEENEFPRDDPPKMRLSVEILISPFRVSKEGRLACHIQTEQGSLRAGSVKIVRRDGAQTSALPLAQDPG